jgi:hypothetical protein
MESFPADPLRTFGATHSLLITCRPLHLLADRDCGLRCQVGRCDLPSKLRSRPGIEAFYTDLRQISISDCACVVDHVRYMRNGDRVHGLCLDGLSR